MYGSKEGKKGAVREAGGARGRGGAEPYLNETRRGAFGVRNRVVGLGLGAVARSNTRPEICQITWRHPYKDSRFGQLKRYFFPKFC